jgi:P27 family predicted phage terminase small subunit
MPKRRAASKSTTKSQPTKRAPRQRKSEPLRQVPEPPAELGPHGKNYWNSLAPQLIDLGILTPLHLESFRVLCEQWQMYRALTDWLDADPTRLFFTTDNGYQQETPQVRLREKALAALKSLWMKFGLTPHGLAALGKHGGVAKKQMPAIADFAKRKYEE